MSFRFEPTLQTSNRKFQSFIDKKIQDIYSFERKQELRQRARTRQAADVFEKSVTALINNTARVHFTGRWNYVLTPRGHAFLNRKDRYRSEVFSSVFPNTLDLLSQNGVGLTYQWNGVSSFEQDSAATCQARCRAGIEIADAIKRSELKSGQFWEANCGETVVLHSGRTSHWDNGRRINYEDNELADFYRSQLAEINDSIQQADLSIEGPTASAADTKNRFLKRHFNNGRFDQGGRLFGGFWQPMSKEDRSTHLRIDGQQIATLDYDTMYPALLYAYVGEKLPENPYCLPRFGEPYRVGVKKIFAACLFGNKERSRMPRGTRQYFEKAIRFEDIYHELKEKHRQVADQLNTNIGFSLMFDESELLVDVLSRLRKLDIVALPLHDAVIVQQSKSEVVEQVMKQAFKGKFGGACGVSVK